MTTLSPVEPDARFFDLESLICDADDMLDVLTNTINEHFSKKPQKKGFVISPQDGNRLFFLASMVTAMSRKARQAYYVAWENEITSKESQAVTGTLWELIGAYFKARAAWEAVFDTDRDKGGKTPEWIEMEKIQAEIIEHRCATLADISIKAAFLLNDESSIDRMINCTRDGEPVINFLLRSMIIEEEP